MEQRFIVNGINNDKIELASNYDVRKLNRLLDAKDQMWITKVKEAREEIIKASYPEDEEYSFSKIIYLGEVVAVLDKLIEESKE